ncbi:unnamed protein product [Coregonus sp. 'balchen']|nr:unnamed protein product [Coregonus sp. 'balchen']
MSRTAERENERKREVGESVKEMCCDVTGYRMELSEDTTLIVFKVQVFAVTVAGWRLGAQASSSPQDKASHCQPALPPRPPEDRLRLELGVVTDTSRMYGGCRDWKAELRPRLCSMKKGATGYGFNLHSDKSKPGQYIRAVDQDSPADKAGLKPQDKILQVNSMSVVGMQHSEVVAAIKAGGDETSLLVVDREAEAFFNSCNVIPTEAHLTGPLPEPVSDGGAEEEVEVKSKVSVKFQAVPAKEPDVGLALSMSLAQAKERAHQKRSAKKVPAMDWRKRNELFSNL